MNLKILTVLTYYRPHTSGLTIYAERLAKALTRLGDSVTVLTMQHEASLPREEEIDGVTITRAPVLFRVSKGVISPAFWLKAFKLVRENDIVHLHLPQFDAAVVALIARLFSKPCIITFHCDIKLPPGPLNKVINLIVSGMDYLAGRLSQKIVTYTRDYAENTECLKALKSKVEIILPPVELPPSTERAREEFYAVMNPARKAPVIGMAARLATEKGVEILLGAMPKVLESFPNAMVIFAGQYKNVLSEESYYEKVMPPILELEKEGKWKFAGVLDPAGMDAFFSSIDLLVVPSLNATESFGLVQIEAMMHGVPVVVSDLPGVRQSVAMSGMGKIFPIGDSEKMADYMIQVLSDKDKFSSAPDGFFEQFSPQVNAGAYQMLYRKLSGKGQ